MFLRTSIHTHHYMSHKGEHSTVWPFNHSTYMYVLTFLSKTKSFSVLVRLLISSSYLKKRIKKISNVLTKFDKSISTSTCNQEQ